MATNHQQRAQLLLERQTTFGEYGQQGNELMSITQFTQDIIEAE